MREYRIPTNYKDAGYIFNGMIATRNAIDAVVLGIIGFLVAKALPFKGEGALSGYILFIGLFAVIGITGIHGIPVSVYATDAIRWRKRRKPYLYNHHGQSFSMTAAELMLSEPQIRDKLADTLEKLRHSFSSKEIDYIEGQTFQFAPDPELEALKFAEEQLREAENTPDNQEEETNDNETPQQTISEGVNFSDIAENIILRDQN